MNRGEVRVEVRDILGETTTYADFWTEAELNRHVNEAVRRFNGEMVWPWLVTEATGSLPAGESEYELPDGIDTNKAVNITMYLEGQTNGFSPVRVSAFKGFQLRGRYGSSTAARPMFYYTTAVSDGSGSGLFTTTLKFVPAPTGDIELEYQYFRVISDMTADSDIPDVPVEYHKALVHYAAGTAWLKEITNTGSGKAQEQFELYRKVLDQAEKDFFGDAPDQPLVMGKDQPQYDRFNPPGDAYTLRIPETLGP